MKLSKLHILPVAMLAAIVVTGISALDTSASPLSAAVNEIPDSLFVEIPDSVDADSYADERYIGVVDVDSAAAGPDEIVCRPCTDDLSETSDYRLMIMTEEGDGCAALELTHRMILEDEGVTERVVDMYNKAVELGCADAAFELGMYIIKAYSDNEEMMNMGLTYIMHAADLGCEEAGLFLQMIQSIEDDTEEAPAE